VKTLYILTRREYIAAKLASWTMRYLGSRRLEAAAMVGTYTSRGLLVPDELRERAGALVGREWESAP
jgi:hypothetical protein